MYDVTMPKLSDSMEVGKILAWKVKEGDAVHEGDILAEIESDKAAMDLEAFHDGVIAQILQADGAEVAVGQVIARVASAEEAPAAPREGKAPAAPLPPKAVEPAGAARRRPAPPPKAREGEAPAEPRDGGPRPRVRAPAAEDERAAGSVPVTPHAARGTESSAAPPLGPPAPRPPAGGRIPVSPLARNLAQQHGIGLATLQGTGPGGRIVAADVERAITSMAERPAAVDAERPMARPHAERRDEQGETAEEPSGLVPPASSLRPRPSGLVPPAPGPAAPAVKPSADEELPPLEVTPDEADVEEAPFRLKTQARRVTASKHVIPHFYMTRGVDVTVLLERKEELKASFGASVTHVVMLAVLKALAQHPEVNRSYDRGKIIKWKNVNLGLAVDTEEGLTVAVLRQAQSLGLKELVERTRALVERARAGKLAAEERLHPTFTISNLGMFDVEHFEPIINPPSAVTLGVASALTMPVVRDGGLAIGQVMRLTLSCDHRIIDGVTAARFLRDLKALLEDPAGLLGPAKRP